MKKRKRKHLISVWLNECEQEKVLNLCNKYHKTKSEIVRMMIDEYQDEKSVKTT